ncbi:hypothetical protein TBLA_0I03190 [Henningerozyma blattae CBS 6284]|uniref:Ribosomal protein n=1 Tax=Henningerozyma blattae (strain ATCC 34711 / CBS 6284 / DSM 70876 / NBRC 10599 / NRRL Y-10934 / UCD 77-7) TaxID=1071380 RepID=I2H9C2_HENB6|nr:hypothetical protein TBLA_0I03190 [Tetrapisispora blattae CBS 6284]CCH62974.1 hypothetical protein TBLA_0I03190 [Tetrapisispora blattae CBS 6284]
MLTKLNFTLARQFHCSSTCFKARILSKNHPLKMEVPLALRYLRAIESGRKSSEQTVTLQTVVAAARGNTPLRGEINFHMLIRKPVIAVFTEDPEQHKIAKEMGIDIIGGSELIDKIASGEQKITFQTAFATTDMVQDLARVAQKLGKQKVLPQLKKKTVGDNIRELLQDKLYVVPFAEKASFISFPVGKCSFTDEEILRNLIKAREGLQKALREQNNKKPSTIIKATLTSTHGPGIDIDLF